jgi:hypothetical protein
VWALYLEWVEVFGVVETAVKVYRRYLMFDPQVQKKKKKMMKTKEEERKKKKKNGGGTVLV